MKGILILGKIGHALLQHLTFLLDLFYQIEKFRFIFVCVLSYTAKKTISNRTNCLVPGRRSDLESENSLLLGVQTAKEQSSKDCSLRCAPQERLLSQNAGLTEHPAMLNSFLVKFFLSVPQSLVFWVLALWEWWAGRQVLGVFTPSHLEGVLCSFHRDSGTSFW